MTQKISSIFNWFVFFPPGFMSILSILFWSCYLYLVMSENANYYTCSHKQPTTGRGSSIPSLVALG